MKAREHGRRRFLKEGAALAGLAVGAIRSSSGQTPGSNARAAQPETQTQDHRAYGERSRFETAGRWPIAPEHPQAGAPEYLIYAPSRTPLQDLTGIITPNPLHYFVD